MKILQYLLAILLLQNCYSQINPKKEVYIKDFKWSITVPENFETVSPEDWKKMQNKGEKAIEDTFGQDIVNQSKTIFVFKSGQGNVLEANYQPFDISVDGDYLESWNLVNDALYETFRTQLPKAKIVRKNSVEKIDNLEFNVHTMEIAMPNNLIMTTIMYSRLFGKREFTLGVIYIAKSKGKMMLDAWRNSNFGK